MTAPLPFTVHAALPCQPHAGFAASLAAELGDFDDEALERGLAALALPHGSASPRSASRVRAGALRVREDGGLDDLLIDRVVTRGRGHEAIVAVVLCELGRRAGMPVGVVGAGGAPLRRPRGGRRRGCSTPPRASWSTRGRLGARARVALRPPGRRPSCSTRVQLTAASAPATSRARSAPPTLRCALPFDETAQERGRGSRCGGCARD